MFSKNVHELMNAQITHEMHSAYLYLSMAAYFESVNMPGAASWMRKQFAEEQEHAMKFYEFIIDRGGRVSLQPIPAVTVDFASPKQVFQMSYEHEQKVTGLINGIYAAAVADNDVASQVFLHWFINEQVEEEKNVSTVVDMLNKIGDNPAGLFMLDAQLGRRADD